MSMFEKVIRKARNEQEIYFLLTAYIDALRFGDQLNLLPDSVKKLPLEDNDHIKDLYHQLVRLDKVFSNINNNVSAVIKDGLCLFAAALARLDSLAEARTQRVAEAVFAAPRAPGREASDHHARQ